MDDQQWSCEEITQLLDIVREMAMVMAKLEKRPKSEKTLAEASELELVLPLPTQYPHIPLVQPTVGLYEILALGMLVGVPLPR